MQKYKLWLLFFFAIFSFTFAMIIWTIVKASSAPVHQDESFLQSYHSVDENYNKIVTSNMIFQKKYDAFIYINDKKLPLTIDDVYMSQRVFEARSLNKKLLNVGKNSISVEIKDKNGNIIQKPTINIRVTRTMDHYSDVDLDSFELKEGIYVAQADVKTEGNWNITGFIEVEGIRGSFFIKTNTK